MRKVAKAAAVALMTPLTAAAIAVSTNGPANAADSLCPFWPKASITPPSGTIRAGSAVHVSATVSGMTLGSHLQIQGPGLNQQVGPNRWGDGVIAGDVTVPSPGRFTLTVFGNGTKCQYGDQRKFSVNARSASPKPKPTHHKTSPVKTPKSGGDVTVPGSGPTLPSGTGVGAGGVPTPSLNNNSPFSLPSVGTGDTGLGFQYPTPDPQIAAPNTKQVRADNVSASTPIKWGQSIAAALVLLLLSAHFGMWSRRQRLAVEARAEQAGPGGRTSPAGRVGGKSPRGGAPTVRQRRRAPATELATTGVGTPGVADDTRDAETGYSDTAAPAADTAADSRQNADGAALTSDRAADRGDARQESSAGADHREAAPPRRGYRGRRRRS